MVARPDARVLYHPDPLRLEDELASRIRDHKELDPWASILVVAPSQRVVLRLREQLPRRLGPLLGVEVLNPQALAFRRLEALGEPAPRLLADAVRETLIAGLLRAQPELELARYAADRPGVAADLAARLNELREAGISPADLDALDGDASVRELARAYADYTTALESLADAGRTDRAGLAARAARVPAGDATGARLVYREAFAYGAYEWIGVHLDLLRSIPSTAGVTFLVPGDLAAPAWSYARDVVTRHVGVPQPLEDLPGNPRPFVEAARALFDPESRPAPLEPGRLRFTHAQGPEAELTLAARRAMALLESGVPAAEIALVARNLEPYLGAAESLFARHGLPVDSSGSLPLTRYPAPRTLALFLRVLRTDFDRRSVIALVRSRRLARPEWTQRDPGLWRPQAWDRWSRDLGLVDGVEAWTTELPRFLRGRELPRWMQEEDADLATRASRNERDALSAELLGRLVASWAALRDRWRASRRAAEHAVILREVQKDWIRCEGDFADAANSDPGSTALDSVWDRALEELGAFESALPDGHEGLDWDAVHDFMMRSLESTPMTVGPGEGIAFLDVRQARGLAFRHVFTLGFNDRRFPQLPQETPLLPDAVRRALRARTGRPLAIRAEGREEERLLLAQLACSVTEHWTVSWQRADAQGKALSVSLALRELVRLLPGSPSLRDVLAGTGAAAPARMPTDPVASARWLAGETGLLLREEAALLAAQGDAQPTHGLRRFLEALDPELAGLLEPSSKAIEALEARDGAALAFDGAVRRGAPWRRPYSKQSLEQLARCPLAFFFERILGIRPLEEDPELGRVRAREMGVAVHRLLERLYGELHRQGRLDGRTEAPGLVTAGLELLDTLWDEAVAPAAAQLARRYPLLYDELEKQWREEFEAFLRKDLERLAQEGHRLLGVEEELFAELSLEASGESGAVAGAPPAHLSVRGILDRATQDGSDRVLLVDYKTSGRLEQQVAAKEMLRGTYLQIPLYMLLAEARWGPHAADAEILGLGPDFLPDDGYVRAEPLRLEAGELDSLRAGLLDTLAVLGSLPVAGRFPFHPGRHCTWCDFRPACRRRHPESQARVEAHPDHRDYFGVHKKTGKLLFAALAAAETADADDDSGDEA